MVPPPDAVQPPQGYRLTDDQIRENLLFSADKVGETMTIAMHPKRRQVLLRRDPPDLSVIARARGDDWLYTYLRTFYRDDNRATGWNNLVFPSVGMPHVLWELQGQRAAKFKEAEEHGETVHKFAGFEQLTPGKLSTVEYDCAVADRRLPRLDVRAGAEPAQAPGRGCCCSRHVHHLRPGA